MKSNFRKCVGILAVLCNGFVLLQASDTSVDGIYYNFNSANLTAKVTFRGDESNSGWMWFKPEELYTGDLVIPSEVTFEGQRYTVVGLDNDAFAGSKNLETLSLPATVGSIGSGVFSLCNSLRSITVHADNPVYFSDDRLLYSKSPLRLLVVPRAVTGTVSVLEGVTEVEAGTFQYCSKVEAVVIPKSVTRIGDSAFDNCQSLLDITISENTTVMGRNAFSNCVSLEVVDIPSSVLSIPLRAFDGCTSLVYVILHEGLERIERSAFFGCSSLSGIYLPETLQAIDDDAFLNCYNLATVQNHSSLDVQLGATTHGYVAYYATELLLPDPTAIRETAMKNIIIDRSRNMLILHDAKGKQLYIYNLEGMLLLSRCLTDEREEIHLNTGAYLAYLDGCCCKVVF